MTKRKEQSGGRFYQEALDQLAFTGESIDPDVKELFKNLAGAIPSNNLMFKNPVPHDSRSWERYLHAEVAMTQKTGTPQRIYPVNPSFVADLVPHNTELKRMLEKAWSARQDKGLSYHIPIGVAVFDAQTQMKSVDIDFRSSYTATQKLIDWVLEDPKRRERFEYILENYVLSQTESGRYHHVLSFLSKRRRGNEKPATLLDIGTSSGYALFPLLKLNRLSFIALDRMPEKLIPNRLESQEDIDPVIRKKFHRRVKRVTGEADSLPLEMNSVDFINYTWVTPYVLETRIQKVIQEAKRVLREGGLVFIYPLGGGPYVTNSREQFLVLQKKNGVLIIEGVYAK